MEKLRVGILGAGHIAGVMADTLAKMEEAQCIAVASRNLEKAEEFATKHNVPKACGSYEEMLKLDEVDLVYVATPHSHHLEHGRLCIQYGKPVLMEKAFTSNAKEAKELIAFAKEKQVFIAEAIWVRYMPMVQTIREVMESGIIGTPRFLTANLGYPIRDVKRLTDPALAGGALLDVGVYTLNFASMFFGKDVEETSVTCVKTETGVDAQDSITLIYKDGRMAQLSCSMETVSDRYGMIHGSSGYMMIENINNFQSVAVYDRENKEVLKKACPPQISGYEYEVLACREALEKGLLEAEAMPHSETIHMMEVMDEIREKIGVKYPWEE
ncbi:MAG: Gfo/Idh/MocA family oxidoreductase [Lachnospiraceae bacterium]|nr:Gfo/Idh/MocA family oxidoreductase [Lachnospiraceae bacterium]